MRTPKTKIIKKNPKIPHNHVRHVRFLFFKTGNRHTITEPHHQQQQTNENKSEERTKKKNCFYSFGRFQLYLYAIKYVLFFVLRLFDTTANAAYRRIEWIMCLTCFHCTILKTLSSWHFYIEIRCYFSTK